MSGIEEDTGWYYNLSDGSVHQGKQAGALDRLGPYPDKATAQRALQIAAERNKAADAADKWND